MSKRLFRRVAIVLIASVLFTAVAHACSDVRSTQAVLQAPCDHDASRDNPRSKAFKDNCDSVRYGMLSTQVAPSQVELFELYSNSVYHVRLVSVSLPDVLPLFWRSKGPPVIGLGLSPLLSHVVLRV